MVGPVRTQCPPPRRQAVHVFRGVFGSIERFTVETIGVVATCVVVFFIAHAQDRSQTIKHGDDNNQQDEVNEIDDGLL